MSPSPSHFEKSRFYRSKVRIANPQISRSRKRRSTARLQTDVRPSRDGSRAVRVRHASIRPNLSRPRVELGPNDERFRYTIKVYYTTHNMFTFEPSL